MFISEKEIQVFYGDTDMMGVIYHANYLKWFELGRNQLVEDLGFNYLNMEKQGFCCPVYEAQITYKKAVKYGDKVFVRTWIEYNDGVKTIYGYEIVNGNGEVCAEGKTTHVIVRKDNFRPVRFRKYFPEWNQKYEEVKKK